MFSGDQLVTQMSTLAQNSSSCLVFASGALVYRCDDPDFYADMIRKMYQATTQAFVFNMPDASRFPDHSLLVGHDRDKITAFCQTLSPRVTVTEDYLEDDFTVFMYRE